MDLRGILVVMFAQMVDPNRGPAPPSQSHLSKPIAALDPVRHHDGVSETGNALGRIGNLNARRLVLLLLVALAI
jgi:hypothetical protein